MENPQVAEPSMSGGDDSPEWGSGGSVSNFPRFISESVAVWSEGPEADIATDNIKTW